MHCSILVVFRRFYLDSYVVTFLDDAQFFLDWVGNNSKKFEKGPTIFFGFKARVMIVCLFSEDLEIWVV